MIETADDRAGFVADFGISASWTVGAVTSAVAGLFHNGSVRLGLDDGPDVLNRRASLSLPAASVPASAGEGDVVVIDGVNYQVKSIERDGTGWCVVRLEESVAD